MKFKTKKKTSLNKRLARAEKTVQFIATAAVIAMTVYTLIPKHEKLKGVDAETLIDNAKAEDEEKEEASAETEQPTVK